MLLKSYPGRVDVKSEATPSKPVSGASWDGFCITARTEMIRLAA